MDSFGHIRLAAGVPAVSVADVDFNVDSIVGIIEAAEAQHADILVLPELCITGYTCGDLFGQQALLDAAENAILRIAKVTENFNIFFVIGAPIRISGSLFNCAVAIRHGEILGIVPKSFIPNYGEFYEKRWFRSGVGSRITSVHSGEQEIPFGVDILFHLGAATVGIEICEDLWVPIPPSSDACLAGADVVLNLSATNETSGKHAYLRSLISQQSARCRCAYAYASAGFGESTTDLVFTGNAIIAEDGVIMAESPRFTTQPQLRCVDVDTERLRSDRRHFNSFTDIDAAIDYRIVNCDQLKVRRGQPLLRYVDPYPFVPSDPATLNQRCEEIVSIQSEGLMKRLKVTGCKNLVVGISGGLDSTLALLIAVRAFDRLGLPRTGILGVTMPGFGTTDHTRGNAHLLMDLLGVTSKEIPIHTAVEQHFRDIGHDPEVRDVTYENSQARERTQILMDLANQCNGMVLGTGDLSELALGWATYNGDQMSMYGVNSSVPKTLVRHLVNWFADHSEIPPLADALRDVIATPVSPELLPPDGDGKISQKTEHLVGPYELHDFFLYHMLRYGHEPLKILMLAEKAFEGKHDREEILSWLRVFYKRFFAQQFKRSCMPDGPKVGSICLSPRGDWRMPSDASATVWLRQLQD